MKVLYPGFIFHPVAMDIFIVHGQSEHMMDTVRPSRDFRIRFGHDLIGLK